MKAPYHIAIVGATGIVGQLLLRLLAERSFPVSTLSLLASPRSAGKMLSFQGKDYVIKAVEGFDFTGVDLAFFAAGSDVSATFAPKAVAAGALVIDKSSYYRYDSDVPLLIPEVNPTDLSLAKNRKIIATPNCSTTQLAVALKPIYDAVGLERLNVCTYQSVSGAGSGGVQTLQEQSPALLKDLGAFPSANTTLGFNVVPKIDQFLENGYTKEEMKVVWEMQKIFHDPTLKINVTAARVPVFYGHSEAVHLETQKPLSVAEAKALLRAAPGVTLLENDVEFPTALSHAQGTNPVYVGRIRADLSHERGLNLWIVADNLRKGAALNAIQIAELVALQNQI